jgi:hypothetical protein
MVEQKPGVPTERVVILIALDTSMDAVLIMLLQQEVPMERAVLVTAHFLHLVVVLIKSLKQRDTTWKVAPIHA